MQTTGEMGTFRQGEGNAISIDGGRPESNNYTLDGLANTDPALNTPAVILSQDAIQEFKILSEDYSAEYGYSANQVAIVSKSGSNQLHGTAFEFFRNNDLDAREPTPGTVTPNPELRQNQFGFVLGGPVYIPKVYDGRNKTFWLANYEGWRIVNGYLMNGEVPTAAELGGDFSASGLPAFDLTPGSPCQLALSASTSSPCMPMDPNTGLAFPGGMIQPSRFSKIAQVALAGNIFPAPTPACVANPGLAAAATPTIIGSSKSVCPTPPINRLTVWIRNWEKKARFSSALPRQATTMPALKADMCLLSGASTPTSKMKPVGRSRTLLSWALGTSTTSVSGTWPRLQSRVRQGCRPRKSPLWA